MILRYIALTMLIASASAIVPIASITTPAHAAPGAKALPKITAAWLVGDWGSKGNGKNIPDCEQTVVSFSKDGTYGDDETKGRYRTDGKRIIYFERVELIDDEDKNGRPKYIETLVTPVTAVSNRSFRESGQLLIRCGR